jgi:predicted metal-binding protein
MQCKVCNKEYSIHCFPNDLQQYIKSTKSYAKQEICKTCKARPTKAKHNATTRKLYRNSRIVSATQANKISDELKIVGWNGNDEIYF